MGHPLTADHVLYQTVTILVYSLIDDVSQCLAQTPSTSQQNGSLELRLGVIKSKFLMSNSTEGNGFHALPLLTLIFKDRPWPTLNKGMFDIKSISIFCV